MDLRELLVRRELENIYKRKLYNPIINGKKVFD